jgi:phosphatidylglycerol:prolipoprotein diacylglycerol transferase
MWPELFDISTPWFTMPVRTYGVLLMIGFLGGVWWACKRAARVKANPDILINIALIGLFTGVIGARAFYVIHYYDAEFAGKGWGKIFDITQGGMEFYGCFIGCFVGAAAYLLIKRVSFRLYMDIIAPSFMFGICMGRLGCFLNGCCWGGLCPPEVPWAVTFPPASRAHIRQWEDRQITLPAELIRIDRTRQRASLLNYKALDLTSEERREAREAVAQARKALATARTNGASEAEQARLKEALDQVRERHGQNARLAAQLERQAKRFNVTPEDLAAMARWPQYQMRGVHPVQLYAVVNALTAAILLNAIFYRRKRHGVVSGLFFFIYPAFRIIEEIIRTDNPHDTLGLTVSQFTSLVLVVVGVIWMAVVLRSPLRSPRAIAHVPSNIKRPPDSPATTG